jgi:glycosyltransferase involved in cell wall biosynthesis
MKRKRLHSKKKILFHSCHSRQFSGFGKNCRNTLKYLQSTGKYEIVEFANAHSWSDKKLKTLPWKCIGSGPDLKETIIEQNKNEISAREMSYGLLELDRVIAQEKPDIYIGAEDIWAFQKTINKPWWNKTNCVIWTTLDSLPLLPDAISAGEKIKTYLTWANFAKNALHKAGLTHAKCLHGGVETKNFKKLSNEKIKKIREENEINDEFIIGFVFRNQLRKSVPNLIKGFKKFKKESGARAKLLLHTGWSEGWDIGKLVKENEIDNEDILTTYFCENCNSYKIQSFNGQKVDCPYCQKKESLRTLDVSRGPSEKQLNEIYNIMDIYCHPFTSGGQEIPIQEAKLTELITLVTNYSCGEDMCEKEAYSLPLDWSEYREPTTHFIKASTCAKSICENITKVFKMSKQEKVERGKKAREFVLENYDQKIIGKQLEEIIDSLPEVDYDFKFETSLANPEYLPPKIQNDTEWIKDIYNNMFGIKLKDKDIPLKVWTDKVAEKGRREVFANLKNIAIKENLQLNSSKNLEKNLKGKEQSERIAVVCKGNDTEVLYATALLKSIRELNPDAFIHFICHQQYFPMLKDNPYIDVRIIFHEECEDHKLMEENHFNICYILPDVYSHKNLHHKGKDLLNIKTT